MQHDNLYPLTDMRKKLVILTLMEENYSAGKTHLRRSLRLPQQRRSYCSDTALKVCHLKLPAIWGAQNKCVESTKKSMFFVRGSLGFPSKIHRL
jgi:hypothetical protein